MWWDWSNAGMMELEASRRVSLGGDNLNKHAVSDKWRGCEKWSTGDGLLSFHFNRVVSSDELAEQDNINISPSLQASITKHLVVNN